MTDSQGLFQGSDLHRAREQRIRLGCDVQDQSRAWTIEVEEELHIRPAQISFT